MNIFKRSELYTGLSDGLLMMFLISMIGNFIGETMGCQFQKLLKHKMWLKQLMVMVVIFFTLEFSKSKSIIDPTINILKTVFIYVFYIIFTKMNGKLTIVIILLFTIVFIMDKYIEFYNKNHDYQKEQNLQIVHNIIQKISYITVFCGFIAYFFEKRIEYPKNFHLGKFLFGVVECKSLK